MSKPYPFDDHFINVFNHNLSNYFIRVTSNHHDILLPLNALEKIESEKNHFFFFFWFHCGKELDCSNHFLLVAASLFKE